MAGAYDDRDGYIWMDGAMVPWRDANVHILTHALHYASAVFEGERCYNGKIFKSVEHSKRLKASANMIDFEIPWSVEDIEKAKYDVLKANGWTDAYVRAVAWRGSGEDMVRGELWHGADLIRLTATESLLMRIFSSQPHQPVNRTKLVEELGRDNGQAQERAVDVQITRLRRKIERDPKQPRYLQTVRGAGYMLAPD